MAEESQDESQKTEDPTQKRLDESHKKGQVASSREINNWFILLGGTILVLMVGPGVAGDLKLILARLVASSHNTAIGGAGIGQVLSGANHDVAGVMIVPLGILAFLALLASLVQHAPLLSFESIKPKLEKISPVKGTKRLFSSRAVVEFVKGLLKLIIVGSIATLVTLPEFQRLSQIPLMNLNDVLAFIWSVSGRLLVAVLAVMTVIARLDFLYQKM